MERLTSTVYWPEVEGFYTLAENCPACGKTHEDLQLHKEEDSSYYVKCPNDNQKIYLVYG